MTTKKIVGLLEQLEAKLSHSHVLKTNISKVSVGWHIEHSLEVLLSTSKLLVSSNPAEYKPKFSVAKFIILTSGIIPRGKGRAPKSVIPIIVADNATQVNKIEQAKAALTMLESMPPNHFFNHPLFGHLNIKIYKKFIHVHTYHHYKIINDLI